MSILGRKTKEQDVCLLTETNGVQDHTLEAGSLHAESVPTAEAWGLDSRQQCRDELSGKYIQFISAISYNPVRIYKDQAIRDVDVGKIAAQTEDEELVFIDEGRNKDSRLLWLGIIGALLTLFLGIIALIVVNKPDTAAVAASGIMGALSIRNRKRKKARGNNLVNYEVPPDKPINAMIISETTRTRYFRHLKPGSIPEGSYLREYEKGLWLHVLGLTKDLLYWPIEAPQEEPKAKPEDSGNGKGDIADLGGTMPTDLYMAKHCATEVNEVYGLSTPVSEKIKLGIFVFLIVCIIVIIFMLALGGSG